MAWTAGVTRTTGDLITAAQWNSYLGAAGSLDYLKGEADKLPTVSFSAPSRAIGTVYQNSSKIRLVAVEARLGSNEVLTCYIGTTTAGLVDVGSMINETDYDYIHSVTTFIVPPSYYYKASNEGTDPTLQEWHEWDLH